MVLSLAVVCIVSLSLLAVHGSRAAEDEAVTSPYAQWHSGPPADADYFPIAVWLQGPQNAPRYKAAGINLYIGLWKGPTEQQLEELARHEMPVICSQNEVGLAHIDNPIIVGWMHGDEPDNAQAVKDPVSGQSAWGPCIPPEQIVDDYEQLRQKDPSRPILLNLGQGVANDEWHGRGAGAKLSDYETYVKGGDIISFDVYPVVGIRKPDGENYLWYVPKGVDRLVRWTEGRKIIWNCIECTSISEAGKRATPQQVKAEVWMSLIHGSTGIIYFVHQFEPTFCEWALLQDAEMLEAVAAINAQIASLAPVLNSATVQGAVQVTSSDPEVPVDVMAKRHQGTTYLFAVGMRNGPATASFEVADLPATCTAEVLGEDRQIEVKDGRFSDEFAPYAVHLYRLR